jgi:hypothetical protein
MKARHYFSAAFVSLLIISCSAVQVATGGKTDKNAVENFCGEYSVFEKFDVRAGALTGQRGRTNYTIRILSGEKENSLIIEKFANSYNAAASVKGDSLFIPSQKFPYLKDKVTIWGKGKLTPDTLFYNYFSGGPAGQILCECKAVKK